MECKFCAASGCKTLGTWPSPKKQQSSRSPQARLAQTRATHQCQLYAGLQCRMSAALTAACLHMAHALALGLMMSVGYRVKVLWLPRADFKAMIDSKSFKIASAVQLNVTEWSPYFVAALLYLHTQGAGSNLVAWGSVLSSLAFSVSKLVVFHGKPAPLSSTARYLALAALIVEVYGTRQ